MKKLLAMMLALCMVASLAACADHDDGPVRDDPTDASQESAATTEAEPSEEAVGRVMEVAGVPQGWCPCPHVSFCLWAATSLALIGMAA